MLGALLSPTSKLGLVGSVQYRVADGSLDHAGVQLSDEGHFVHMPSRKLCLIPGCRRCHNDSGACMLMRRTVFEQMGVG